MMKALILAAGRGTRIRSVHGERPKCLISCDGEAILDHQINGLLAAGVQEIGIVIGYESEQILSHVCARYGRNVDRFQFIFNPQFATTNNIYSLWVARTWLRGDSFVCLNADVLCDPEILRPVVASKAPISMIVDPGWRDETMKVVIRDGRIVRISKGISETEFSGTYIGITAFSADVQSRFFRTMERWITAGKVNEFFNVAVQDLADQGVLVSAISTVGLPWAEIDDPSDLAFARAHVFPKLRYALVA
jgi:L-glutamine-phosphate cytidylyltransferase